MNLIGTILLTIDMPKYVSCLLSALGENANFTKSKNILELLANTQTRLDKNSFNKLENIYYKNDQVSGYYYSKHLVDKIKLHSEL